MRRPWKYGAVGAVGVLGIAVVVWAATGTFRETRIPNYANGVLSTYVTNRTVSGDVTLGFRDYADTADDDMAHTSLVTNCTTTTSGAEDCDLVVNVTTAGATVAALTLDADGNAIATARPWTIAIQSGAFPAATCIVGEIFIDTDETVDTNCTTVADNVLCLCHTANTWKAIE